MSNAGRQIDISEIKCQMTKGPAGSLNRLFGLLKYPLSFLPHGPPKAVGLEHLGPAPEAQDPADQFPRIGDRQGQAQAAVLQAFGLLRVMPDTVLDPGGRRAVEFKLYFNARPAHHRERVLHEGVEIEVQRNLVGMVGRRHGLDALYREHARFASQMAIADEVEAAARVPEPVGIDLAASHAPARRRVIPHLNRRFVGDGPAETINRIAVLPVPLVRSEPDAEGAVELLHERHTLRGQRGGCLAERGLQRRMELGAFERRDEPAAERERHEFGWREPQAGHIAKSL